MLGSMQSVLHGSAVGSLVFGGLLAAVCVSDLRTRRIPNALVLAIALTGVVQSTVAHPVLPGLLAALAGFGVGLAIWLPFYALRMLGAGDVKFFATACAWIGPGLGWRAAVLTALVGGVLAVAWVVAGLGVRRGGLALALGARTPQMRGVSAQLPEGHARKLPYGIAMAIGVAVAAWFPHLLF